MPLDNTTAITFAGVFPVWDEGIKETYNRDGRTSRAVRTLVCNWNDRHTIVNNISGGAGVVNGFYVYAPSQAYPQAPFLVFNRIDIHGIPIGGLSQDALGLAAYKYARILVQYKSLEYDEGTQVGQWSITYGIEAESLPGSGITLADGTSPSTPALYKHGVADLVFTRHNHASIPFATIFGLAGSINSGPMLGAAAGTILYRGPHSDMRILSTGNYNWNITHLFKWRAIPWTKVFTTTGANKGTWQAATLTGSAAPLYPSADLSPLFT